MDAESEKFETRDGDGVTEQSMCHSAKKRLVPLFGNTYKGKNYTILNTPKYTQALFYYKW